MEISEVRKNTHQTHIESLVFSGKEGLNEINNYIKDNLDQETSKTNKTYKIDGAPALLIGHNVPGYPEQFVGIKSVLNSPKNAYSSISEIKENKPNIAVEMAYGLDLAKYIPDGEIWQGDVLFTKGEVKEQTINGTDYLIFQPNTIVYAFSEENPDYDKLKNADFGICFHTIYRKEGEEFKQSFKVDLNRISVPDNYFLLSPNIKINKDKVDSKKLNDTFKSLTTVEQKLFNDGAYEDICNNAAFTTYWATFENHITSDQGLTHIDKATFINDLKQWVETKMGDEFNTKMAKLKTEKGKERATLLHNKALKELQDLIDANKDTLSNMVDCFNLVVDIKDQMLSWQDNPGYNTYVQSRTKGYIPSSGEGIALSDDEGNIVKLVNRAEFSKANRNSDIVKGFEHESLEEDIVNEVLSNAWMLRSDGKEISCDIHNFLPPKFNVNWNDNQVSEINNRLCWYYHNTQFEEVKDEIELFFRSLEKEGKSTGGIDFNYKKKEISPIDTINNSGSLETQYDGIFVEYCNEFIKARQSEDQCLIRLSTTNKNWFDIIANFLVKHKDIKLVTVTNDPDIDKSIKIKKLDGKELKNISTDDIIFAKGRPIIESMSLKEKCGLSYVQHKINYFYKFNEGKDYLTKSYDPDNMVNTVANTDRDPSVKATKEYHNMKTKKLKKGQMVVSSLTESETPDELIDKLYSEVDKAVVDFDNEYISYPEITMTGVKEYENVKGDNHVYVNCFNFSEDKINELINYLDNNLKSEHYIKKKKGAYPVAGRGLGDQIQVYPVKNRKDEIMKNLLSKTDDDLDEDISSDIKDKAIKIIRDFIEDYCENGHADVFVNTYHDDPDEIEIDCDWMADDYEFGELTNNLARKLVSELGKNGIFVSSEVLGWSSEGIILHFIEDKEKLDKLKNKFKVLNRLISDDEDTDLTLDEDMNLNNQEEKDRIKDVIDIMKDVQYGFISTKDGKPITDREWIHNNDHSDIYEVNRNPRDTIINKLGLCIDQSIAIKYLMNKLHPEDEVVLYALRKSPKGHCVPCYCHDGKWFYLENAWDKEKGLHGPFESQEELEEYLGDIYYENHKDDTPEDSEVRVDEFNEDVDMKENLVEDKNVNDNKVYNLVYNKLLDLAEDSRLKHKDNHKNYEILRSYIMKQYRANKLGHTMLNKLNKLIDSYDNMKY